MADEKRIDITKGFGVEIVLPEKNNFLKVRETLGRIGISKQNVLYQSCHILHKQGRYFIIHFRELFALDDYDNLVTENDIAIRNTITDLLSQWELVTIVDPESILEPRAPIQTLKIVRYADRNNWAFDPMYQIGKHKKLNTSLDD